MDKIKRLVNCPVPVSVCNFKCPYCYIGQTDGFGGVNPELEYSPEFIANAISVKRMGGPCHLSLCGMGETLLAPYVTSLVRLFTQDGHYCSIVTNGTITKRISELCDFSESLKSHIFIKFSFHYLELQRLNLLNTFVNNVKRVREAGISFTIEIVSNDCTIDHIQDIHMLCENEFGAKSHIVESRKMDDMLSRLTKLPYDEHIKIWDQFKSPSFDIQKETWGVKRKEFCYAGDWIVDFFMDSGDMQLCLSGGPKIQNMYENPDEPVHFAAIGTNCPWPHCCSPYVTLASGAIPEYKAVTYAKMRNRVCSDGTEWLQPKVKSFFDSKLIECNEEYSENKKIYIDALMAEEYGNQANCYDQEMISKLLHRCLNENGYCSIAIFGTERFGAWVQNILLKTDINIVFCVAHDWLEDIDGSIKTKLWHFANYPFQRIKSKGIPTLSIFDYWPSIDAIIVAPYADYDRYKKMLTTKTKAPILNLLELVM